MIKATSIIGIIFIMLAVIVFIFADGLRRWYSGIFFAIMGTLMLVKSFHPRGHQ